MRATRPQLGTTAHLTYASSQPAPINHNKSGHRGNSHGPDPRLHPRRPGREPVIRTVPWPKVGKKAALIKVGACGVCGTDLHILKGHWPKPLPWPFTLGHELGGVIVECGDEFTEDFMSKPLKVGSKVMIPPLMPCGRCYYCIHYPAERQQVPDAGLLRPLSRLRQGAAPVGRLGRICLCRSRHAAGHQDLQVARRHVAAAGRAVGAADLLHPRLQPRQPRRRFHLGRHGGDPGLGPDRHSRGRGRAGDGGRARDLRRRAGRAAAQARAQVRRRGDGEHRGDQIAGGSASRACATSSAASAPIW